MNNRNTSIAITVATALICGCCSLFACIMGFGAITGNGTYTLGGTSQPMPPTYGYVFLCLSLISLIVGVAISFFVMRRKPQAPASNEQIPPAS